ncbi:CLU1 [Mytilus edulis]|uniref:TIF31 n=1 Tax=Mytilus edulis TaxID=6550 RepID=A0A8S3R1Y7_MYTED|nr:CLU1 [Mytilus edulis]
MSAKEVVFRDPSLKKSCCKLGEEHDRTKESSECLKHLTQQAVVFQKKMNEIYKGEKSITFPPLQIQTPSIGSVLETLNVVNGIVFVQISPEDIERFKKQMALKSVEKDNELEPKELEDKLSIKEVKEELPNGTLTNGSLETNNSEMALPLD